MRTHGLHRKALTGPVTPARGLKPYVVMALDMSLYALGSMIALMAASVGLKLLGSALVAAGIVRMFLVGHDACHGSFFATKRLNNILGRIAFLPSMTAFTLWDVGHNVAHHGFNNLKGRDQVWIPYSMAEFERLPRYRRVLERIYRSGVGCGLYYLVELWWKKLFFASRAQIGSRRMKYKLDSALVSLGAIAWVAIVGIVAYRTHQNFWLLAAVAIALPFALWNSIIGFVVFLHHTHPGIAWFHKRREWQSNRAYLTATVNVRLPLGIGGFLHHIMEHSAHHVNPRISMFGLASAQRRLNTHTDDAMLSYRLDWKSYRDLVRRCKLYDYSAHTWLDWRGVVTSTVVLPVAPAPV